MHLDMKNIKRNNKKKLIESPKRSLDEFVISHEQYIIENLDMNLTNRQPKKKKKKKLKILVEAVY